MPKFDGTGPRGQGPMTGQGQGNCDGTAKQKSGRGLGLGAGHGSRGQNGCILSDKESIQKEITFLQSELEKLNR